MPRTFPLAAVLAVRQQKESAEERKLTALLAEINVVRAGIARAEQASVQHGLERAREIAATHSAAHHQASHAGWTLLQKTKRSLEDQLRGLEIHRAQQQTQYLKARSDREMLTELQAQQRGAWDAERATQEAKQMDDVFASRRIREATGD